MRPRLGLSVLTVVVVGTAVSGCQWEGLNSVALPGTAGRGPGAYTVEIEMPDAATLEGNSRVRVDDVTVGRVVSVERSGGHALVLVSLDGDVHLPANAVAKIGQTSLLGSPHVELSAPVTESPTGALSDGDVIPLARAGAFPTTEQTLASLSLVLNGGGLAQVNDITRELGAALSGRESSVRDLLGQLDTALAGLDGQKDQIVAAMDGLSRLSGEVAAHRDELRTSIDRIEPALRQLNGQREDLSRALIALGNFGDVATRLVRDAGADFTANLHDLEPVLKSLADSGSALTESMRYLLTFPFPIDTYQGAVRGDYANGEITIDMTLSTLDKGLLIGTPAAGTLTRLESMLGLTPRGGAPTTPVAVPQSLTGLLGGGAR
ncbi:MCE family protein [Rhodococcus spelaei]|uniref:MCE family protein n=1 Tax=Rhodococcus spelaei TaxID=2546320 RepID=A0A541BRK4_9NOCA|nr:MCE family protein [Rhodococcus spelaei]TQF74945.1 MCE family protein [Rhodococcus spelaei]